MVPSAAKRRVDQTASESCADRALVPVHVTTSRAQARQDCEAGLMRFLRVERFSPVSSISSCTGSERGFSRTYWQIREGKEYDVSRLRSDVPNRVNILDKGGRK